MLFNVGDLVRVKVFDSDFVQVGFMQSMHDYSGKLGYIESIREDEDEPRIKWYTITTDLGTFMWSSDWLECAVDWDHTNLVFELDDVITELYNNSEYGNNFESRDELKNYFMNLHVVPKNKLTQEEIDVLLSLSDGSKKLNYYAVAKSLITLGWFTGVDDKNDTINDILSNFTLVER